MRKTENIILRRNKTGLLELDIISAPSWDEFDKLMMFLQNEYDAKIVRLADGPDARVCTFKISEQEIQLFHDDFFGNSMSPCSEDGEEIVDQIAIDLDNRLNEPT